MVPRITVGFILCCGLSSAMLAGESAGSAEQDRTAAQVYKNIQVLKSVPANEIPSTMQFISSSLGVHCDHCHVEHAFEKDDKKPKQQAREMIKMVEMLNGSALSGSKGVTCYTCHRGSLHPRRTPVIADSVPQKDAPMPQHGSANDLLKRYVQAVGGAAALQQVSTEVKKGTLELEGGIKFPIEISLKGSDKRNVAIHFPNGDSIETENGEAGWSVVPGRPFHTMSKAEVEAALIEADPTFMARLGRMFTEFAFRHDEQIDGKDVSVIRASRPNGPPVRFYIDKDSGLLVRLVRYVQTPLGRNPTQIDYSDYRDVSGLKLPFRWTVAQPQGRFTVQLSTIDLNVPIDEARFVKPAETAPSGN